MNDAKRFGSRCKPRKMLTAEAAINLCRDNRRAVWVRLPVYEGTFHIWPGGRKEFYPDKQKAEALNDVPKVSAERGAASEHTFIVNRGAANIKNYIAGRKEER